MATQLQLAEAQFLGFMHRQQGYSLISLVQSMGLSKKEWEQLVDTLELSVDEKREIDEYFKS